MQLTPGTRIFAFQFKAPKGKTESQPYLFRLEREQHDLLVALAAMSPGSVFYVFPFYLTPQKLQQNVPALLKDTWLLDVAQAPTEPLFATYKSRTLRCSAGRALVNPEYRLASLQEANLGASRGIPAEAFAAWYRERLSRRHPRNPWRVRGLRISIVPPAK